MQVSRMDPGIGLISPRKSETKVDFRPLLGLSSPLPRGGGVSLRFGDIRDFEMIFGDIRAKLARRRRKILRYSEL